MLNRIFISAAVIVALVAPAVVSADAEVYFRVAGDPASNTVGNVLTVNALSPFGSVNIEMRAVLTGTPIYGNNTTLRNIGSTNATLSNLSIEVPPAAQITSGLISSKRLNLRAIRSHLSGTWLTALSGTRREY